MKKIDKEKIYNLFEKCSLILVLILFLIYFMYDVCNVYADDTSYEYTSTTTTTISLSDSAYTTTCRVVSAYSDGCIYPVLVRYDTTDGCHIARMVYAYVSSNYDSELAMYVDGNEQPIYNAMYQTNNGMYVWVSNPNATSDTMFNTYFDGTDFIINETNALFYFCVSDVDSDYANGHCVFDDVFSCIDEFVSNGKFISDKYYDLGVFEFDNTTGTLIKKGAQYELEIPLNVNVNAFQPKKLTVTWEQSVDNVDGWETEFYIQQTGKYGKNIWNVFNKKSFDTGWMYYKSVQNYKETFTFNALALKNTENYLIDLIDNNGYAPQITEVEKTNIMMRNKFVDDNGLVYYSNFVYLYQDSNYEFIANEVSAKDVDNSDMTTDVISNSVVTDSDVYQNSSADGDKNNDTSSSIGTLRTLLNDIKDFPKFFGEFFMFFPDEVITALSALLIALVPICLIKLIT